MNEQDNNVPLDSTSMYANVFSFLGLPLSRDLEDKDIDAMVMGIPYDLGTSGRSGTRNGPRSIRQASSNLCWEEKRWPCFLYILLLRSEANCPLSQRSSCKS